MKSRKIISGRDLSSPFYILDIAENMDFSVLFSPLTQRKNSSPNIHECPYFVKIMQSSRQEHQTFAGCIQANTCSKLMATVINMSSCLPVDNYMFKVSSSNTRRRIMFKVNN